MNNFGHFSLALAWLLSLCGVLAGIYGSTKGKYRWVQSAANATLLVFILNSLAFLALAYLFIANDYSNQYVWQFSNRSMPVMYKVSAIWGGMAGSMLLWCLMLSLSCAVVALKVVNYPLGLRGWLLATLNSSSLFFLSVTFFATNPFEFLNAPFIPPDGNGLNPILQNPFMAIHPPMLYAGFTTFAVPYAFCMAALLSGDLSNTWLRLTRRWTLLAWMFLTAGIVLGGYWAYIELGWGGFWAWDPVENASFLPWLTGTAFLHSSMVQQRKNMLKFWNVWLIIITYALTVFGTFLTRSGVVQSVHAFASTDVGWIFLVYLGLVLLLALILTYFKRSQLSSSRKIESFFSREAAFLVNNLIFLSVCFATFWGVMFPVFSEALTGQKQAVGVPFFNAVNVPIFLLMVFMMGIGPLIAWRKASLLSLRKTFLFPFLGGILFSLFLLWGGIHDFYPLLSYGLSFFVLMTIMGEFHRGVRAQRNSAETERSYAQDFLSMLGRHTNRYAGHLVHFGVLVMVVAITASMAHKVEREFAISLNEDFSIGRYVLTLKEIKQRQLENYEGLYALVAVSSNQDKKHLGYLRPELRFYTRNQETTTEVAIRKTAREDLYLILAGLDDTGQGAAMKVYINPLQSWLWLGALIVILGTFIVILPKDRERFKAKRILTEGV